MPVMGPSRDIAYAQGDKAFADVIKLLEDQYGLSSEPLGKTRPDRAEGFRCGFPDAKWFAAREELRRAIRELIWSDHCCSF